jgi:hypothetical protein
MMLNLTQHVGTPEQGVTEPNDKAAVQRLLTFEWKPSGCEITDRAKAIAALARAELGPQDPYANWPSAMIGGAPFLMGPLEIALRAVQIHPAYAFSVRASVEQVQPDGTVKKVAVFKHAGFVLGAVSESEMIQ